MSSTIINDGIIEQAFLIGSMVCFGLYGISCAQTIFYYRTYQSDNKYLKILVGSLLFLETTHTMLIAETAHNFYIVSKLPEHIPQRFTTRSTFAVSFGLSVLITSIVQIFYAWKIWTIGNTSRWKLPITLLVIGTSIVQFFLGTAVAVLLLVHPSLQVLHEEPLTGLYSTQLSVVMLCDILITVALVKFLHSSRSGFKQTSYAIDRIIIYSVNVGIVTSIVSICIFVTYHTLVTTTYFTAFTEIISKVYVNALLVTLNSRISIRKVLYGSNTNTIPLSNMEFQRNAAQTDTTVMSVEDGASYSGNKAGPL